MGWWAASSNVLPREATENGASVEAELEPGKGDLSAAVGFDLVTRDGRTALSTLEDEDGEGPRPPC